MSGIFKHAKLNLERTIQNYQFTHKDVEYAFKLSFLNRCDEMERPIIEEYFQRSFGIDISDAKVANVKE